jgi:hypothetical protein
MLHSQVKIRERQKQVGPLINKYEGRKYRALCLHKLPLFYYRETPSNDTGVSTTLYSLPDMFFIRDSYR